MTMDRSEFRHKTEIRVRNFEVDWQNILHNAVYLQYFETGRIEYLREIGAGLSAHAVLNATKVVVVRNEVNYYSPARFDDLLNVYTRLIGIRNSSFTFEGLIEEKSSGRILSDNVSVHVWLDPATGKGMRVPGRFRDRVDIYEKKLKEGGQTV